MLKWLEAGLACQNTTIFTRLYDVVSGAVGATFTDEFGRTAFSASSLLLRTVPLNGSVENTWIVGFGFQFTGSSQLDPSPSTAPHIALRDGSGEQLRLEAVDAAESKPGGKYYKWRVMRGATELARTVEKFNGETFAYSRTYFEWKATVRTGTNGSFSLKYTTRKGGTQTATWSAAATGINTANQASDGAYTVEIAWENSGGATVVISDLYVNDTSGAKNNDFIGVQYMEYMKPDGDGNQLDFDLAGTATSIEDALDEQADTQNTTEDDKRIVSSTVGDVSLASMSNLSSRFDTTPITGMQVRMYGKMDTTGTRDVNFRYRKTTGSPSEADGAEVLNLTSTAIVGEADTLEDDPNTSTDFVVSDIQGIQIGPKLLA